MGDYYLGEIRIFSGLVGGQPPQGWLLCNGQTLQMQQNMALFSLLGTAFGGDGKTTFQLPDLRGRTPVGVNYNNQSFTRYQRGNYVGVESVTLQGSNVPSHTHNVMADLDPGTINVPTNAFLAQTPAGTNLYADATQAASTLSAMAGTCVATVGGQGHENRQPFLAIAYCIASSGIYPPHP